MASFLTSCLAGKNFVMSLFKSKNTSETDIKESADTKEFHYATSQPVDQEDGVKVDSDLKCVVTCCISAASNVKQNDVPSEGILISIWFLYLFGCHFKFIILTVQNVAERYQT